VLLVSAWAAQPLGGGSWWSVASLQRCLVDNGGLYVAISYQIKELLLTDGDSLFADWFGALEAVPVAKIRVAVNRME
jgi:hypothetical protein